MALTCKGKILESAKLGARFVQFGRVSRKPEPISKTVTIMSGDAGPINPVLKPVRMKGLDAKLREIEAGKSYELEVTITPPFADDRLRSRLELDVGVKESPSVEIPVYATNTPRVVAHPRRITMPAKPTADWEQRITLKWDDNMPHKITGAKASDPRLEMEIENGEGKQQVVVRVPEEYEPTSMSMTVAIETDDQEAPSIYVPISVAKRGRSNTASLGVDRARAKQAGRSTR